MGGSLCKLAAKEHEKIKEGTCNPTFKGIKKNGKIG
jgi:hypothetical protein